MQPCYKNNKNILIRDKFPNSINTYKKLISLPSAAQLNKKDLNYIIQNIRKFFKNDKSRN
jgi:dTDP-4-amino-4,6-dideoxygalactose transaminase